MVSVICPIYNEEMYIGQCITSLLLQDYPAYDLEILFMDGMSKDATRGIVLGYAAKHPHIHLLDNPEQIVPYAMNRGIQAAKGEIIIRLDAHALYPHNYISQLVYHLKQFKDADNVGGVCKTRPCNGSASAIAIAEALSSSFGVGNSYYRTGSKEIRLVDTVPFGCFRKTLFDRIGLYDTELIRNQDDELNGRIINSGGKIYLIPTITIKYYARDKISKVRTMFYQYGLYKPMVYKKLGKPATIRQFFPLLFTLGLALGAILSVVSIYFLISYCTTLLIYAGLAISISIKKVAIYHKVSLLWYIPFVFFVVHTSYGYGYIVGILKILFKQSFCVESNR